MTFPPFCPLCHGALSWWDRDDLARCTGCDAWIDHLETLTLLERRSIDRILAIDTASTVKVSEDVL